MPTLRLSLIAGLLLAPSAAYGNQRAFTHVYESRVLSPGDAELEPWATYRVGRDAYHSRLDQRLEFELGLTQNLQTALYLNLTSKTEKSEEDPSGAGARSLEASASSEWKYRLSDPVADALGAALYFEGTLGPDEAELEGKLILDKQSGNLLGALNLVFEQEWELGQEETESEQILELDLGVGYFFTPSLILGVEAVSTTLIEHGEVEASAVYLGPSLALALNAGWLAVGVLPQVFAPKSEQGSLDLEHGERLRARLLLGFHL